MFKELMSSEYKKKIIQKIATFVYFGLKLYNSFIIIIYLHSQFSVEINVMLCI